MRRSLALLSALVPLVTAASPPEEVRITLLGTGTPVPSVSQAGASTLIEAGDQTLLFDCGRDCATRLFQARPELYNKVDRLFLTHLHSDHVVGIPDLWLNGWTQQRDTALRVWGPPGTRAMMSALRQAYSWDIHIRADVEHVPATTRGLATVVTEIGAAGVIYDADGLKVTAFLADHAQARPAFSYKIEYRNRSVVLSGDTRVTAELTRKASGADVLVQEVVPPAMLDYLKQHYSSRQVATVLGHHSSVDEIGPMLQKANPRLLVYSHYTSSPASDARLERETGALWKGATVMGQDLMTIRVGAGISVCPRDKDCYKPDGSVATDSGAAR